MSSIPPFETLLGKAPEWIQDPLPFEGDVVFGVDPSAGDEPEFLTAFVVALDSELKPTIFLKTEDWDARVFHMERDATPFDLDVVNLYVQKYRSQ